MKIFNKFIWSKKEPSNKNDIWFDGSTWKMYTEEAWQSFTLSVDDADKVAKVLENASEVYQEKLNAGYGIIIDGNTISLDVSSIDIDTTYNIGSIELFDQLIRDKSRYDLHEDDIKAIQEGKLITTTTKFGTKIPALSVNHMMQSSTSIAGYILTFYVDAVLYNISIYDFEIVGGLSWKTHLDSLAPDSNFISNSYNAIQNATVTKKFEETDAQITELSATLDNKADKIKFEGKSYVDTYGISTHDFYYSMPNSADGTEDDIIATKNYLKKINGQDLYGKGNIVIEGKNYDNEIATLQQKDAEQSAQLAELSEELASNGVLIEDLQNTKIDRENDDYYPNMAVGLADNLAGVDVVDSEINFRRSGGGAITDGVARIETIKGNSVVWNQLMDYAYALSASARVDGEIVGNKIKGYSKIETAASNMGLAAYSFADKDHYTAVIGHKYMWIFSCSITEASCSVGNKFGLKSGEIWTATNNGYCYVFPFGANSTTIAANTEFEASAIFFDLTQMFGSGNEPTTIEEFYQRIPMGVDMNAYNEGEVIHMDVQSIESQGVNAWDEEWELGTLDTKTGVPMNNIQRIRSANFIKVFPNTEYYFNAPSSKEIIFYDENFEFVKYYGNDGAPNIYIPAMCHYVKFSMYKAYGTTYNHDICFNLSDTAINGKYFPYIKRQEDLSIIRKYFPQGMRSAGSAHDEIRYNKANGKWEKVVRIGEVDLGAFNYTYQPPIEGTYPHGYYRIVVEGKATGNSNMLCSRYSVNADWTSVGIRGSESSSDFYVKDSAYTSAASFKAAMQGVILYYELAEPIVTELDEADQFKDLDYQVWNAGTEKANAEGKSAPLAADITYGFNAIGKIKELESLVAALRAKVGI